MVELINISSAFTYGLSSSLALCLASCLPIYLPILFSHGENKGFRISIGFAIGRYAGYTFLGIIAAILGATFLDFFNNILPKISIWIIFIFGLFTIIFGILILVKKEINIKEKNCKTNITKLRTANNPLLLCFLWFHIHNNPMHSSIYLPFITICYRKKHRRNSVNNSSIRIRSKYCFYNIKHSNRLWDETS